MCRITLTFQNNSFKGWSQLCAVNIVWTVDLWANQKPHFIGKLEEMSLKLMVIVSGY